MMKRIGYSFLSKGRELGKDDPFVILCDSFILHPDLAFHREKRILKEGKGREGGTLCFKIYLGATAKSYI